MYISRDPPLVLHVADLLTDSIVGRQPGSYLANNLFIIKKTRHMNRHLPKPSPAQIPCTITSRSKVAGTRNHDLCLIIGKQQASAITD